MLLFFIKPFNQVSIFFHMFSDNSEYQKVTMARNDTVFVFDFDKTIIGCDSDNWVVEDLGFNDLFTQLLPTMPWNSVMDRMMKEIHSSGKTANDIEDALKRAPIDPTVISAIKSAHAFGCDMRILTDANVFFIETILKHHGLTDCFKEIITNPSFLDEQGRLRISPYHDFTSSSHGCTICPPNMCKGVALEKMRASLAAQGKKRFIHAGDGSADFCAGLSLKEGDYLLPRKDFPVWDLLCKNPMAVNAKICEWSGWAEFKMVLFNTINQLEDEKLGAGAEDQASKFHAPSSLSLANVKCSVDSRSLIML